MSSYDSGVLVLGNGAGSVSGWPFVESKREKRVHPGLLWVEAEPTTVEEDRGFEVLDTSEAANSSLDGHDLTVRPFGNGIVTQDVKRGIGFQTTEELRGVETIAGGVAEDVDPDLVPPDRPGPEPEPSGESSAEL